MSKWFTQIWRTLGNYLNVFDLKCCQLVSREFNQLVMNETNFKDTIILNVNEGNVKPEELGKTQELWMKMSLNFAVNKNLESIHLRMVVSAAAGSHVFGAARPWKIPVKPKRN